ncbi:MAG: Gfo/Idh/MocA family oxidoreductase [Proteobacteria bacterium]|nr:Gfo/Idh/MocA family oxidoreductase [Pseudomonadota bacterium]
MAVLYTAAIIGCGRIGSGFDSTESENILTHAKAYTLNPKIELIAVMDADLDKANAAGIKWECESFDNIDILLEKNPDILSICTPDASHYEILLKCLNYRPKAVIAEKPLTLDVSKTKEIVTRYQDLDVPLFVNFSRRFDYIMQVVRERIYNDELGGILHASIKYSKGIMHNGSHAIDASNFLFGKYISGFPVNDIIDYDKKDPTLGAVLCYSKCPAVFLMACDERAYSIFEVDIVGEKGRIKLDQSGMQCREYKLRRDPIFDGYIDIEEEPPYSTNLGKSMQKLAENVVGYLEGNDSILCSGTDALAAQQICQSLLSQYQGRSK